MRPSLWHAERQPRALAAVLRNAVLPIPAPTLSDRAQLGRELLTSAIEAQDPALEFWAHVVHFNVMVKQGKFGAARERPARDGDGGFQFSVNHC